jgi:type IV secretion system protein VirB5
LSVASLRPAQAQFAVVDVAAGLKLLSEIQTLEQQLTTLQSHLAQARSAYAAITGPRGMERLLSGTVRNYLPPDWASFQSMLQQTSANYSALSAQARTLIAQNAILSDSQVAALGPRSQQWLNQERQTLAAGQLVAQSALAASSARFASIQQLIDAIPRASDEKAVLDLQARIGAEQGMLQNEQTKLSLLLAAAESQRQAVQQQNRERALADIGSLRTLPAMGL